MAAVEQKQPERRQDFYWTDKEDPYVTIKQELIEKYPQITELMGPEPLTKWIVLATVILQVGIAIAIRDASWTVFLLTAWIIGSTINHSLFLAIHEITHNLGSKSLFRNKLYSHLANLPIGFPYAASFGPYHYDHHRQQGVDGVDTDIATPYEAKIFASFAEINYVCHCLAKATFMFTQILFYALRPVFVAPETLQRAQQDPMYFVNQIVQFGFDYLLYSYFGIWPVVYLLLSTFFAGSITPVGVSGHFLAEHYVFDGEGEDETWSYYGPLNYLTYNVGYHREHHVFPNIAWRNLPKVREIASDYFDKLPECKSWHGVIWRFIFDDNITPFCRVKRVNPKKAAAKAE